MTRPLTLGFLVPRRGTFKVLGAVVQAALERGHRAVLLWDPVEAKPGETVAEKDLAVWPGADPVVYRRGTPLGPVLRSAGVTALVGTGLYGLIRATGIEPEAETLRREGLRLFSLDYAFETLTHDPESYRVIDVTFYASEYQRRLHWRLFADRFAALGVDPEARSAVCGSTMMDQLAGVDRLGVRKRYGLGPEQPVVLLMSLKMAVPDPWRRLVWGGAWRGWRALRAVTTGHAGWVREIVRHHGYRALVEALREHCRRRGAALVVKSRAKNQDPRFLRRLADVFVYDEQVYPYTSMELMAIADFCVHFQSGAVLEAAYAGVPSLAIAVSQEHLRGYVSFEEAYGGQPGSLQNFPGVVWLVDGRETVARLAAAPLDAFRVDDEARRRYVEKFLGFDDTRSSHRVLDIVERVTGAGG